MGHPMGMPRGGHGGRPGWLVFRPFCRMLKYSVFCLKTRQNAKKRNFGEKKSAGEVKFDGFHPPATFLGSPDYVMVNSGLYI